MAKKKEETKEVTAKDTTTRVVATTTPTTGGMGMEDITADDMVIPKLLLMQPMSELVTDGEAKMGEIRDSLTKKLMGSEKNPVEVVIFSVFKTWLEFKDGDYMSTKPITHLNMALPLEEIASDGAVITRDKVINFYCLIPSEIESGDAFPFVLSCRRTSMMAAKTVNTYLQKMKMSGLNAWDKTFKITSSKETNDKGTFFILNVEAGEVSKDAWKATAKNWYDLLAKSKVRIDDSDLVKDTASPSTQRDVTTSDATMQ